jgi:SAM-dependent methyltransferase
MTSGDQERKGHRYTVADIDISVPNVARVYDLLLGGKDNFTADREFVRQVLEVAPKAPLGARANRVFLDRVVRYLAGEAGIAQFLDLGSGLPTQGNVSEVAHDVDPAVHVVHVDNDPVVYTHSKALLADKWTTDVIVGDIRRPGEILDDPGVRKLIDFGRPVGLLLLAILHHIRDNDDPARITAELRDAMPPGSYMAISSFRMPGPELPELRAATVQGEKLHVGTLGSGRWREDEEILSWFGDWELLSPGLVPLLEWRPSPGQPIACDELYHSFFGGVAKKPAKP